jgi:hypothetical protein
MRETIGDLERQLEREREKHERERGRERERERERGRERERERSGERGRERERGRGEDALTVQVLTDQQNNNRKTHREDNQTPTEKQFKKHKHTGKRHGATNTQKTK